MATTKAITFAKYSAPLVLGTLPLPELKPTQILVKVYSVSLNPVDFKRRDGMLKMLLREEFPAGICYDVAGIVEKVGGEVATFVVGDRICARSRLAGTLAEYCVIDDAVGAKIPDNVSFDEAAGLPLAGQTAYQSLIRGGLEKGQKILIAGGAGGVGTFAIQLAKHVFKAGLVVTTCSAAKSDFCKSLGADEVIDYTKGDPYHAASAMGPFDMIFDTVGDAAKMGGSLIKPGHFVVSVAAIPEPGTFDRIGRPLPFFLRVLFTILSLKYKWGAYPGTYNYVSLNANKEDLTKLMGYLSDGTIKVVIDSKFEGLEKGPEAFVRLETNRALGKVIVVVRPA